MTDQFQPLDLKVKVHAKEFLKVEFEFWYAQQITNQLGGRTSLYYVQVPLKLSVIKPIQVKWLLGIYDHLRNTSDTIIKKFIMAGIKDALKMELPLEDRFGDLDA